MSTENPNTKGNDKIRLAVSNPELGKKLSIDISDPNEPVYWYMRFNIPLDEASVSERTMSVTDTDGYIMRVDISYNTTRNMIVISPLDTYEQGVYYILSVSRKVRSSRGQNLKSKIYIVFKLLNNQISEYRALRSDVEVAAPRKRPKNYDKIRETRSKMYAFEKQNYDVELPQHKVRMAKVDVNLAVPIIGVVALGAGFFLDGQAVFYGAAGFAALTFVYFLYTLFQPSQFSSLLYNLGALAFNNEKHTLARKLFKIALEKDPYNELAEYGLNKSEFYDV